NLFDHAARGGGHAIRAVHGEDVGAADTGIHRGVRGADLAWSHPHPERRLIGPGLEYLLWRIGNPALDDDLRRKLRLLQHVVHRFTPSWASAAWRQLHRDTTQDCRDVRSRTGDRFPSIPLPA